LAVAESARPAYLHAPEPDYPESAREEGQEGLVVLRVLVSDAGRPLVVRLSVTSGSRALDAAAVAAVKRWTFIAARQAGRDVESWMDIPVRFRLR
jgi:protein TonB